MVKAFIVSPKQQQRWLDFLAKPKGRQDILRTLPHLKNLDERFLLRAPTPPYGPSRMVVQHRCDQGTAVLSVC
jgi:hypothetical protein